LEIRLMIACPAADEAARVERAMQPHARQEPGIVSRAVAIEYACAVAAAMRPDVILLEQETGLRLLPALVQASAGARVLLLYAICTQTDMVEAIRFGAAGCVARSTDPQLLAKAVRTVFAGATWFGRTALLQALRSQIGVDAVPKLEAGRLTPREEEILRLIGQGLSNKEIGRRLDISDHTVKTHLHRVYAKLHQSGRYKAFLAQPRIKLRVDAA
jgi:DNA-binding NarL/FixJ family response regulator